MHIVWRKYLYHSFQIYFRTKYFVRQKQLYKLNNYPSNHRPERVNNNVLLVIKELTFLFSEGTKTCNK